VLFIAAFSSGAHHDRILSFPAMPSLSLPWLVGPGSPAPG
jgi:hypothetical protein